VKKVLVSLVVVGAVGCFTITGTYAVLNTETHNARGSIASGTLTFSDKVNAATACLTINGPASPGNVNSTCDPLFTNSTLMYPGTAATVHVTIANTGSIDGSALSVYMPSCTMVTSPSAPSPGGGNPCSAGGAMIYIDESNSTFTTHSCVFPTSGGPCAPTANTMAYLSGVANTTATAYSLGTGPAAGASRYFIIGMELPTTASNTLQGEEALFDLTWHLTT
jgi:hypothetical protein